MRGEGELCGKGKYEERGGAGRKNTKNKKENKHQKKGKRAEVRAQTRNACLFS